MKTLRLPGVWIFGDHHTYDGDEPWWTLRFRKPLSQEKKDEIARAISNGPPGVQEMLDGPTWVSDRQCKIEAVDPWFENQEEWDRFYEDVDSFFTDLNARFPMFALFLQAGQFFAGEELVGLTDDELIEVWEKQTAQ